MNTSLKRSITICILFSLAILAFNGCKKDDEVEPNISLENFKTFGGQIQGSFNVLADDDVAEKGVVIGLSSSPTNDNNSNSTARITIDNSFYLFDDLQLETTYYVRGYTKTKKGTIKYTDEKSFTTECMEIDSILPKNVTSSTTQIVIYGRGFSATAMDNTITFEDCLSSGTTTVKGPSSATSTSLTVNVTGVFANSACGDSYVEVDKTGDACGPHVGISILKKSGNTYLYSSSGVLKVGL